MNYRTKDKNFRTRVVGAGAAGSPPPLPHLTADVPLRKYADEDVVESRDSETRDLHDNESDNEKEETIVVLPRRHRQDAVTEAITEAVTEPQEDMPIA